MSCHRERRWLWWISLTNIKIYVRELYAYTAYVGTGCTAAAVPNATSSGNAGQEVVRTTLGTLTWVPSDHRLIVSTSNKQLQHRITLQYPPWVPELDMARKYHKGRAPLQIATMLNQSSTHSFQ